MGIFMKINYYKDQGVLLTEMEIDFVNQTVKIKNHTDNMIDRAFGVNEHPTMKDFEEFCEYRSIPQTRYNFKTEMRLRGITDTSPMGIMRFYHGRIDDDNCYIEIVEDD